MFCVIHWCKNKLCFIYISCNFIFETVKNILQKASIFHCIYFWGMFYLPIWFENKFDLSWLTAARPIEQGL